MRPEVSLLVEFLARSVYDQVEGRSTCSGGHQHRHRGTPRRHKARHKNLEQCPLYRPPSSEPFLQRQGGSKSLVRLSQGTRLWFSTLSRVNRRNGSLQDIEVHRLHHVRVKPGGVGANDVLRLPISC
jgi:hypothetical protein